jgi:hypothetical protein
VDVFTSIFAWLTLLHCFATCSKLCMRPWMRHKIEANKMYTTRNGCKITKHNFNTNISALQGLELGTVPVFNECSSGNF